MLRRPVTHRRRRIRPKPTGSPEPTTATENNCHESQERLYGKNGESYHFLRSTEWLAAHPKVTCMEKVDPLIQIIELERRRLGISKATVAERAATHPVNVSCWIRGVYNPTIKNLKAIAGAVGLELRLVPVPPATPPPEKANP